MTGACRFKAAPPLQPLTGVRDAVHLAAPAPQPGRAASAREPAPAEDCLFPNVWTPAVDRRRRPVMFYGHGGGFTTGSRQRDGLRRERRRRQEVVPVRHAVGRALFQQGVHRERTGHPDDAVRHGSRNHADAPEAPGSRQEPLAKASGANNLDGAPTVLRNDAGDHGNFVRVQLEGRTVNRSAVGAIVTVRAGDLGGRRSGHCCGHDRRRGPRAAPPSSGGATRQRRASTVNGRSCSGRSTGARPVRLTCGLPAESRRRCPTHNFPSPVRPARR